MQMVFNAIWFILLKERTIIRIKILMLMFTKFNLIRRLLTLFVLILLHHVRLVWSDHPSPCCLCLCWALTAYLSLFLLEGWARPRPPPLISFPSDPRQQPVSTSGTICTYQQWWVPLLKKVTITSLLVFQLWKKFTIFTDQKKMAIFWCLCIAQKLLILLKIKAKKSLICTIQQKSNDYFATRYWALKKVKIISILFTGPRKKNNN
jgi:hypothetical protein